MKSINKEDFSNIVHTQIIGAVKKEIERKSLFKKHESDLGEIEYIIKRLEFDGACVIPNAIDEDILRIICSEYNSAIEDSNEEHKVGNTIQVRFMTNKEKLRIPIISWLFDIKLFNDISLAFFENRQVEHAKEIFLHSSFSTRNPPAGELHYDKLKTLKFWLYLNDVCEENGAMKILERSHNKGEKLREMNNYIADGRFGYNKINGYEAYKLRSLDGKKGSIVIHNTDCWHKAGKILEGRSRHIIRAHSRSN